MYKSVILAFVVLFFVIGVVTVFSLLLIKAVAPDKKNKFYIVSVFGEKDRECTVKISSVLSILTVLGLMSRCEIVAVDNGMTAEEKDNMNASFSREKRITLCTAEEFSEKLSFEDAYP